MGLSEEEGNESQTPEEKAAEKAVEKAAAALEKKKEKTSGLSHEQALEALKETRGEAAKNRIEAKKNREALDSLKLGLAKALGIGGDESSDVVKLTEQVNKLMSKLSVSDRKEAFRVVAKSVGADPDLSWAYLMADGSLDDPDVDVAKVLKAALKEKPALKATQAMATGDPQAGGPSEKPKDMNAFIRGSARG